MHDVYQRDLDLNLLRVFIVVAEEGSTIRAAARLYITQPAVSAALKRLTAFVGVELFTRQGRGIVLTSRGRELLTAARAHLAPLVAAATAAPAFDPKSASATVRIGISDGMSGLLAPVFSSLLRKEAPRMTMIVAPIQFRNVEHALLSGKIDCAVGIADEMSRSILRQPLDFGGEGPREFKCLYDSRFGTFPRRISEKDYFSRDHVIVSYVGDLRGVVEDYAGRSRKVRVSVPTFELVGGVVEGSPLLATVPGLCALPILRAFPRLRATSLPFAFSFELSRVELLWSRVTDEDEVARFVRGLGVKTAASIVSQMRDRARP